MSNEENQGQATEPQMPVHPVEAANRKVERWLGRIEEAVKEGKDPSSVMQHYVVPMIRALMSVSAPLLEASQQAAYVAENAALRADHTLSSQYITMLLPMVEALQQEAFGRQDAVQAALDSGDEATISRVQGEAFDYLFQRVVAMGSDLATVAQLFPIDTSAVDHVIKSWADYFGMEEPVEGAAEQTLADASDTEVLTPEDAPSPQDAPAN